MKQQRITVDVLGQRVAINVNVLGDSGPPVLMVHGIPTNARLWRHVQGALQDRYRTYAMDMIGYGESDMPIDSMDFSLTNQAQALAGVIAALGVDGEVIVVAHDHGGGVAQIAASQNPAAISRLVLINPISFDYWPVLEVEGISALKDVPEDGLPAAAAQAASTFGILMRMGSYRKTPFYDQAVKQNYLRFWQRGPGLTGFKSLIKVATDPTNQETMAIDYSKINCPVMICWAVEDCFMPVEAPRRIKTALAGPVRLEYIERAGHWVQEDRPDYIADRIDDFITEWAQVRV